MYQLLLLIFFAASVLAADPPDLPSGSTKCSISNFTFDCFKSAVESAVESAVSTLKEGVESIRTWVLERLPLPSVHIEFSDVSIKDDDTQLNGDEESLPIGASTDVSGTGDGKIELPSDLMKCSRSDPTFDICLKSAIQSSLSILKRGVKSLGIESLEPLPFPSLSVQGKGPTATNIVFNELSVHGLSKLKIEDVHTQLNGDEKSLTIRASTDVAFGFQGKYEIGGKLLVLPVSGTGHGKIEMIGADATVTFTGKTEMKDGHEYLEFRKAIFDLNPRDVAIRLENLFDGDKARGDRLNRFVNENWEDLYIDLKSPVQNACAKGLIRFANRIFLKVPYDEIFLP